MKPPKLVNPLPFIVVLFIAYYTMGCNMSEPEKLHTSVELDMGETRQVQLTNGKTVNLKLLEIKVVRDSIRNGVRTAVVRVSLDGTEVTLNSGTYNLPLSVGEVQIDCPVVRDYYSNASRDVWGLQKDARFRLWPEDSPYFGAGTFTYPVRQAWFASRTQSGNEPAGLGWAEDINNKTIYYHEGHDFGGAEGLDEIISATDGIIVSSGNNVLEGFEDLPGSVRPDVVYIMDSRGYYIRYSHLDSILPGIVAGNQIKIGEMIGYMGKQGGSGGWVHLHFGMSQKNEETGTWEIEDAYPFLWEAYVREYKPAIKAVARPRHLVWTGQETTLDGTKSLSLEGDIVSCEWIFSDGTSANGAIQKRQYEKAGEYSEILKVTDSKGNIGYDFANIQVFDRLHPDNQIPTIHAVYHPSLNIKPGDPVKFMVRTFGSRSGEEIWDFGDGSEKVRVNSGVLIREKHNEGSYAETVHSFREPGLYIVSVERTNEFNYTAKAHLLVTVSD